MPTDRVKKEKEKKQMLVSFSVASQNMWKNICFCWNTLNRVIKVDRQRFFHWFLIVFSIDWCLRIFIGQICKVFVHIYRKLFFSCSLFFLSIGVTNFWNSYVFHIEPCIFIENFNKHQKWENRFEVSSSRNSRVFL